MIKIDRDQALEALDRAKAVYMASPFPGRFLKVTKVEVRQHIFALGKDDPVWVEWRGGICTSNTRSKYKMFSEC